MNRMRRSLLSATLPFAGLVAAVVILSAGRPGMGIEFTRGADGLVRISAITPGGAAARDRLQVGMIVTDVQSDQGDLTLVALPAYQTVPVASARSSGVRCKRVLAGRCVARPFFDAWICFLVLPSEPAGAEE